MVQGKVSAFPSSLAWRDEIRFLYIIHNFLSLSRLVWRYPRLVSVSIEHAGMV